MQVDALSKSTTYAFCVRATIAALMTRPSAFACVAFAIQLSLLVAAPSAQWIRYPTAGVPRTRDGQPNLAAPAPRGPDGKPDFSGVWENDGYDPSRAEGLAGGPPKTVFFDLAHGLAGPPPYQPWAAELARTRSADFGKDNPDARCL